MIYEKIKNKRKNRFINFTDEEIKLKAKKYKSKTKIKTNIKNK